MDRTIDTSRTIVVTGSTLGTRWRLVWYSAGLLLWSGLIALLIVLLRAAGEWSIDPVPYYALFGLGCFLVFFFAVLVMLCLSTILESRKFLKISGNVLTITPNGIRDRRLTEEFVPWPAVKSVRAVPHEPEYYVLPGTNTVHAVPETTSPFRLSLMDVVLEIDPALTSQTFKDQARVYGVLRGLGVRPPVEDTRPWIKFTIDLWRLKDIDATRLYDLCEAYARAAQAKHAA